MMEWKRYLPYTFKATCGVFLIILSSTSLIISLVAYLHPGSLVAISCLLFGCSLLVAESIQQLMKQQNRVVAKIILSTESLVIDDVLNDISHKLYESSCLMLGTLGTLWMYQIPIISTEQRTQLIQSCFPRNINAEELFMSEGGILKIIRLFLGDEKYRNLMEGIGCSSTLPGSIVLEGQDMLNVEVVGGLSTDSSKSAEIDSDLVWENEKSVSSTLMINAPRDNYTSSQTMRDVLVHPMEAERSQVKSFESVLKSIVTDAIVDISKNIMQRMELSRVGRCGLLASIALSLQMKYSRTSRKATKNLVHTMAMLISTSLVVGSISIFNLKKRLEHLSTMQENVRRSVLTSSRTDPIVRSSTSMWKGKIQMFIKRLKSDQSYRHRWGSICALIVLSYFHQKRQKRRVHFKKR